MDKMIHDITWSIVFIIVVLWHTIVLDESVSETNNNRDRDKKGLY